MDKSGAFYESYAQVQGDRLTQIPETVFPPPLEEAKALHLERW